MIERFKTIGIRAEAEIVERKSRFIATCTPVLDVDAANDFLAEMKKKYWDATHNVFAYQIGENDEHTRQSDDGEPSGTAGMPVLDILRNEGLKNAVVNVTRYFGGTLLGTGGLVRAYGHAARLAILEAGIVTRVLHREIRVSCDYSQFSKLQFETLKRGQDIKDIVYAEGVTFITFVESLEADAYAKVVTDLTAGTAVISVGGYIYR